MWREFEFVAFRFVFVSFLKTFFVSLVFPNQPYEEKKKQPLSAEEQVSQKFIYT
jgi:hypothetical protein